MILFNKLKLYIIVFIISFNIVFAKSGFEAMLNIPFGITLSYPNEHIKNLGYQMAPNVDATVLFQTGYMFSVVDNFAISILGEIGYYYDSFSVYKKENNITELVSCLTHNIQLGLLSKFNIKQYSIGIGGGMKFPLQVNYLIKNNNSIVNNHVINQSSMKNYFASSFSWYVKASIDYYVFFTDILALDIGAYFLYDFGLKGKNEYKNTIGFSSFDIGLQIGFRFGPKP
ncbi:PorT family protein [uncultured Brachyspira sp.]|uniref:PorT family protein n=1 Tax=uncultured Brachyspira sp. TaxID=221953 RepID=UPI002621A8A4|nr:PorT family protein [uncultured Brachyspira sp.]